jgi:hypothetical protein
MKREQGKTSTCAQLWEPCGGARRAYSIPLNCSLFSLVDFRVIKALLTQIDAAGDGNTVQPLCILNLL